MARQTCTNNIALENHQQQPPSSFFRTSRHCSSSISENSFPASTLGHFPLAAVYFGCRNANEIVHIDLQFAEAKKKRKYLQYVRFDAVCILCGVGCLMCRSVFAGYSRLSVLPIFSICLRISGMKGAGQLTAAASPAPGILPHLGQIMQHHNTQHAHIKIISGKPSS